ncbi:unnamed protein product, partial [Thelazia callipaeda]|uniref:Secreted protein n=1 Tax=Thelazia callipaeda TaxID=103827 RepID=A0A0N5CTV6_THECL
MCRSTIIVAFVSCISLKLPLTESTKDETNQKEALNFSTALRIQDDIQPLHSNESSHTAEQKLLKAGNST